MAAKTWPTGFTLEYARQVYYHIINNRLFLPMPKPDLDRMLSNTRKFFEAHSTRLKKMDPWFNLVHLPPPITSSDPESKIRYIQCLHDLITKEQLLLPMPNSEKDKFICSLRKMLNNPNPSVFDPNISDPPVFDTKHSGVDPNISLLFDPNPPAFASRVDPNIPLLFDPNPPAFDFNIIPVVYQSLLNSIASNGNSCNSNRILRNVYEINPEELADNQGVNSGKEWFFFTLRGRKYDNETILNRVVGDGYWKLVIGDDETIKLNGETLAFRKTFQFYKGKHPEGDETCWTMHEFRVTNPLPPQCAAAGDIKLDDLVLCKIYYKEQAQVDYGHIDAKRRKRRKRIYTTPKRIKRQLQPQRTN